MPESQSYATLTTRGIQPRYWMHGPFSEVSLMDSPRDELDYHRHQDPHLLVQPTLLLPQCGLSCRPSPCVWPRQLSTLALVCAQTTDTMLSIAASSLAFNAPTMSLRVSSRATALSMQAPPTFQGESLSTAPIPQRAPFHGSHRWAHTRRCRRRRGGRRRCRQVGRVLLRSSGLHCAV